MNTAIRAALVTLLAGAIIAIVFLTRPAQCATCASTLCNRQTLCGANCGCVIAPGQAWGRCASFR